MTKQRFSVRNRRGQALALVAATIVALLGMAALAVDLSMMYKTRAEAQRAADATALAGASVFLEPTVPSTVDSAHARARTLADSNNMQGGNIDVSTCTKNGDEYLCPEMTVLVIPDSFKVRAWIYRRQVGTFFARILHIFNVQIGAMAAAEVTEAGSATCVRPFILPDYWAENTGEDLSPNRIWDNPGAAKTKCGSAPGEAECWEYDATAVVPDYYRPYQDTTGTLPAQWTGLNSEWRNLFADNNGQRYEADIGRIITLYPGGPGQGQNPAVPSNWQLWRIDCDGDGQPDPGAKCVKEAICCTDPGAPCNATPQNPCGCRAPQVQIGEMLDEQPGDVDAIANVLQDWINTDPSAEWHVDGIDGQGYTRGHVQTGDPRWSSNPLNSPRVFVAAVMEPNYLNQGFQQVPLSNLARFFLESVPSKPGTGESVIVRFLGFASGLGGPTTGTLIKRLRLVE